MAKATALTAEMHALLDWWALAGVDHFPDDDAASWDAPMVASGQPTETTAATAMVSPSREPPVVPAPVPAPRYDALPDTLETYLSWLADAPLPAPLPLTGRIMPRGPVRPRLMVLVDMPEVNDAVQGRLLDGPAGVLLSAMMAAIGIDAETELLLASLTPVRPADGRLGAALANALHPLAAHLIRLVEPQALLIMGDAASIAMTGAGLVQARQSVQTVGDIPAMVSFLPAFLLRKPEMKAQAWRDLKLLQQAMPARG